MILPSVNILNCWNTLRAFSTLIGDNLKDWAISSQAFWKQDEGSSTRRSSLRNLSMAKLPRMGWILLLITLFPLFSVEANVVSFGHDNKVFRPVVTGDSINVMDDFIGSKVSSELLFNNKPVFHNTILVVFKWMPVSVPHYISSIPSDISGMIRVVELKPVYTSESCNVHARTVKNSSGFFDSNPLKSHIPEDANGNIFVIPVVSWNAKPFHIDKDEFFGNSIFFSNSEHCSDCIIINDKLFFGYEKFSIHSSIISPYVLMSREKVSRYSQDLQETVRREDKEPLDNILEIKKQGDTVHVRTIADVTVFDHQKGMTLPRQRPESPEIEITVNRGKGWNILLDDVDKVQSDIGLLEKFTGDASKQINISVDSTLLGAVFADADSHNCGATAGLDCGAYNLGASGSPIQITKADVIDYITYCGGCLDEQNVPDENRWMVIPSWMAVLLKGSDLKDATLTGDPKSIIRTGLLGMIDRFVIYQSNSVGTVAATVDASGFKCYYVLFGQKDAITFANQFTKTESLRSTDSFDDIIRGLMVWDYKVMKPEALGYMYARR
jgi:hypothetical protein